MQYPLYSLILISIISTSSADAMKKIKTESSLEDQINLDQQLLKISMYNDSGVKTLLDQKANVNAVNNHGETRLFDAVRGGHATVAKLLLDNNATVDYQSNHDGQTPLFHACYWGRNECVQLLLDAKADPNIQDPSGNTPLIYAITISPSYETTELLLNAGANPNKAGADGNTPLHEATKDLLMLSNPRRRAVLKTIIQHPSTNLKATNKKGLTALALAKKEVNNPKATQDTKENAQLAIEFFSVSSNINLLYRARYQNNRYHPQLGLMSPDLFGEIEKELFQILVDDSEKQVAPNNDKK